VDQIKTAAANHAAPTLGGPTLLPPGEGSDPYAAEDFVSRLTGMTQSETSSAWCSHNAVIGFNDSGSFVSTLFLGASPSGSISFNGYSQSINAAGAFTDRGALVADPLPPGVEFRDLVGDPVIGCTNQVTFYYASLTEDTEAGFSFFNSGSFTMTIDCPGGSVQWQASVQGETGAYKAGRADAVVGLNWFDPDREETVTARATQTVRLQ
jgi:hypothetical protein